MFSEIYTTFLKWWTSIDIALITYALLVLSIGFIISLISFKIVWLLLNSQSLQDLIDKFIWSWTWYHKLTNILQKGIAWSIFIVFIRWSVSIIWLTEIENFMSWLLNYIPNLLIALIIWFFWIRFASTVYVIVYQAVRFENEDTAKVLSNLWRFIILIFTFTIVFRNINLVSDETFKILLIWLIFMLSLAWWLSFWLWSKRLAKDILNEFRIKKPKKKKKKIKNKKKTKEIKEIKNNN